MTAISPKEHRLLLWAAVVVYVACHFYYVTAPPNGYHHWRESDTISIATNYYFETTAHSVGSLNRYSLKK